MPQQPTPQHWDRVYAEKAPHTVSWLQDDPTPSLEMIRAAGVDAGASLVDVGAGASKLVDRLLDLGFRQLTVLDISSRPLELSRRRLGVRGQAVRWLAQDVTCWDPGPATYALWHDRAVFHFLTEEADRAGYLRALRQGLKPGGHLILATFAPTGPATCSGLPVQRYSAAELQDVLGPGFRLLQHRLQTHLTPSGGTQDFTWCLFQKTYAPRHGACPDTKGRAE